MSKSNKEAPPLDYPRAPPMFEELDDHVMMQRPAPPTYEQSQQPAQQQPQMMPQQQYQWQPQSQPYYATPAYGGVMPGNPYPYGYAPGQPYMAAQQPPVLTLAQGAEIRTTTTGAISIPPPPPGCAPTPAQWAAMQGQNVVVKEQKKRSFFS